MQAQAQARRTPVLGEKAASREAEPSWWGTDCSDTGCSLGPQRASGELLAERGRTGSRGGSFLSHLGPVSQLPDGWAHLLCSPGCPSLVWRVPALVALIHRGLSSWPNPAQETGQVLVPRAWVGSGQPRAAHLLSPPCQVRWASLCLHL